MPASQASVVPDEEGPELETWKEVSREASLRSCGLLSCLCLALQALRRSFGGSPRPAGGLAGAMQMSVLHMYGIPKVLYPTPFVISPGLSIL